MNSLANASIDPELTEEAWLHETFGHMEYLKPIGINKWKYLADNLAEYLKWLEQKVGKKREYAFTLTSNQTDPEKFATVEEEMIIAVGKILTQQTCPVLEAEAYLEYCKDGKPHIHGWYRCDKGHRIYQKIFKRYWPLWNEDKKAGSGSIGGYHKEMQSNKYKDYASAEGRKIFPVNEFN